MPCPSARRHCRRSRDLCRGGAGVGRVCFRSARQECLNHLILFGIKSLRRVVRSLQRFHNAHRPHQGIGNRVPARLHAGEVIPATTDGPVGKVECEEFLGGLLKSYHRAAA